MPNPDRKARKQRERLARQVERERSETERAEADRIWAKKHQLWREEMVRTYGLSTVEHAEASEQFSRLVGHFEG